MLRTIAHPERTLALIKPNAAQSTREILQLIELGGFTVIQEQRFQMSVDKAEAFYAEHRGKPFFGGLVDFMTSGTSTALVLAKPDAVRSWRDYIGPTNSNTAREVSPASLRAHYGIDGTQNAFHGSDSSTSAQREIAFFFPHLGPHPLPTPEAALETLSLVQPTLLKGLTELARHRPASSATGTVAYFARWLQDNNPNKPSVALPSSQKIAAVQ